MKEIFVIYNKNTGEVDGGSGRIDREWDAKNADGSTMSERIVEILKKDPDRAVMYLSNQSVPSKNTHVIIDDKLTIKEGA